MNRSRNFQAETLVGHADSDIDDVSSVAPAIYQTATFWAESDEDFDEMSNTARHNRNYTRDGNPNFSRVESIIAALEGAEAAQLVASGMAAVSSTVLTLVGKGDHVVAQKSHYMGTSQLFSTVLPKFGVEVTLVDQVDPEAFSRALKPTTKLIYVETPTNPLMTLVDLAAIASLARAKGITTVCDSTIATPINQKTIQIGIDLSIHSATKFLGGHHDLMGGVVTGAKDLIERIWHSTVVFGPTPDPFSAWLLLRGLRTLPLRVREHNRNALKVAEFLESHAAVRVANYPGLPSHPQHALATRQMSGGYGGLMSFELKGGFSAAQKFINAMELPRRAVSFGGYETLATQPAAMWKGAVGEQKAIEAGIPLGLIRLSVGLEASEDLVADLDHALGQV
ncbi:PLP-dependent aspartate aminotransferase family protein [Dongia sp.]|uniref:trans-sulfuration enzyme family protein n=1 Tax=Dongia sp. TaxID=1977262 RepID=UPI0035B25FE1